MTSLNYPVGLPSVGTLTSFYRFVFWDGEEVSGKCVSESNRCLMSSAHVVVFPMMWKRQNKGHQPAVTIGASEQAQSFNPQFRWVSPIHSANPHWNVAAHTLASLRYGSTDVARGEASRSWWTKAGWMPQVQCNCLGKAPKWRMGVVFIGVKTKTETEQKCQATWVTQGGGDNWRSQVKSSTLSSVWG